MSQYCSPVAVFVPSPETFVGRLALAGAAVVRFFVVVWVCAKQIAATRNTITIAKNCFCMILS
jgi:hypothetical protein